jgi:hypothetical protein
MDKARKARVNNNRVGRLGSVPLPPFLTLISKPLLLGGPRGSGLEVKVKNVVGALPILNSAAIIGRRVHKTKEMEKLLLKAANVTFCTNTTFSSYSLKESWI